ncbi:winged helix DNA-binding domain-containing protein, partial [Exidia glandulosa HHB12029]
ILCALKGSPKGRLTLEEMYKAIEERFPFYMTYKPYRNSIRHNLSLNSMFIKVARPITDPGKGCCEYCTSVPRAGD